MKLTTLLLISAAAFSGLANAQRIDHRELGNMLGMSQYIANELCPGVPTPNTNKVIKKAQETKELLVSWERRQVDKEFTPIGRTRMKQIIERVAASEGVSPASLKNNQEICSETDESMSEVLFMIQIQGL